MRVAVVALLAMAAALAGLTVMGAIAAWWADRERYQW